MAKAIFQAKLTLVSVQPLDVESLEWSIETLFTDFDGAWTGFDITIGDVVAVDTGGNEAGSLTLYEVFDITTPDVTAPVLSVRYMPVNDNMWGPPDLSAVTGNDCVISRPSTNLKLLPVVSRDLQLISDKFTEYVQNYNFVKILDSQSAGGGGTPSFAKVNGDTTTLTRGMVVYIDEDGDETLVYKATAAVYDKSRAIGLITTTSSEPGMPCAVQCEGTLEATTAVWDSLTGETGGLNAGTDYFLSSTLDGGLVNIPSMDAASLTKLGKAISSTVLDLNIEPPIML